MLILQAIQKSSIDTIFFIFINFFEKIGSLEWFINKTFLRPLLTEEYA